jgi:hypothetical protein
MVSCRFIQTIYYLSKYFSELVIKLGNTILADDDRIETIGLVSGDVLYVEQCGNQV